MPAIPERRPIADSFSGVVLQVDEAYVLAPAPLAGAALVASGDLVIRYAVPYLGKPHFSIVPGLIALDHGEMLTAEAAWDFLLHRSNLYPRADEMIVVKLLDLAEPVQVLAYPDADATRPVARLDALIAADTTAVPSRLLAYLPHFVSLEAWQHRE